MAGKNKENVVEQPSKYLIKCLRYRDVGQSVVIGDKNKKSRQKICVFVYIVYPDTKQRRGDGWRYRGESIRLSNN
jgi:hypothetical protein